MKEANGKKRIYRDGKEITTYKESIRNVVLVKLEPLNDFLNLSIDDDGEDAQRVLLIAKALLERAEQKIYEIVDYIDRNHGLVEVVRASYHQDIKPETMLDIVFTPVKGLKVSAKL